MYALPGMFRKAFSRLSLRKKLTILVSLGVLLPLLVLTYLQYRSLSELQNKTKGAFKDGLRQGLTNVQHVMKQRLENVAVQTLGPIGSIRLSSSGAAEQLQNYFAEVKRSHPEIEEVFAFGYSNRKETNSDAYVALFEKARLAQSFVDDDHKYLFAYDSCTTCSPTVQPGTYLLYP